MHLRRRPVSRARRGGRTKALLQTVGVSLIEAARVRHELEPPLLASRPWCLLRVTRFFACTVCLGRAMDGEREWSLGPRSRMQDARRRRARRRRRAGRMRLARNRRLSSSKEPLSCRAVSFCHRQRRVVQARRRSCRARSSRPPRRYSRRAKRRRWRRISSPSRTGTASSLPAMPALQRLTLRGTAFNGDRPLAPAPARGPRGDGLIVLQGSRVSFARPPAMSSTFTIPETKTTWSGYAALPRFHRSIASRFSTFPKKKIRQVSADSLAGSA